MTEKDLRLAFELAKKAALEAAPKLKSAFGNVEMLTKGDGDSVGGVVTELDRDTEILFQKRLSNFSKNVGFRGEEFGVHTHSDTTWLVDPIDGTAHFIRGLPFCSSMISLIENDIVVMCLIHDFVRNDTYWAIKGCGAYKNDEKIQVSNRSLAQSLLSFETNLQKKSNLEKFLAVREKAVIVATINCGFEFAMIASGKLDGRIGLEPYGKDWDYAPGALLVTEAGGIATNIGETTYNYKNHNYIISNQQIHNELTNGSGAIFPVLK